MTCLASLLLVALLPLVLAAIADALVGDPREGSRAEQCYPPVLVGRLALAIDRTIPRNNPRRERWTGVLLWTGTVGLATLAAVLLVLCTGPSAVASTTALLDGSGGRVGPASAALGLIYLVAVAVWLKSCFTLSGLLSFCGRPLGRPLEEKRRAVAQVVNRPTEQLSEDLLNSALIESAAENMTDSVISPLLAYGLLGLPGAVAYRGANTLDALLGHTDRPRRYVGEATAVIDHAVNLIPDRVSATLLRLFSRGGWVAIEIRAAPGIAVPRSIVAAARSAHVRLERRGSYVVGPDFPPPAEADVRRFLRTVKYAGTVGFVLSAVLLGGIVVAGWSFLL
jgi:adenosylcobinamide-phosphate synthase